MSTARRRGPRNKCERCGEGIRNGWKLCADCHSPGLTNGRWVVRRGIQIWEPEPEASPAPKNCGTESGYYHHLRTRREKACDACRNAHAVAERLRAADKRIAKLRAAEQGRERSAA